MSIYPTTNVPGAREDMIPEGLLSLMSTTSKAEDCFIGQEFCQNLQAFLIGYNSNIYSQYSPYL